MSEARYIPCRIIPCPLCGRPPQCYIELWSNHSASFDLNNLGRSPHANFEPGYPTSVEASCACGHSWVIERVNQITDLDEDAVSDEIIN